MAGVERGAHPIPPKTAISTLPAISNAIMSLPRYSLFRCVRSVGMLLLISPVFALDPTWNYAVQVSATVSSSPPQIALTWVEDTTETSPDYRPSYTVARKAPSDTNWGAPITIPAGDTSFTDREVVVGQVYEYDVTRNFHDPTAGQPDHVAHGYLTSGINVPIPDRRGEVIVVIENRIADAMSDRVARLKADLIGDGWTVSQIDVSADDSPSSVRQKIHDRYYSTSPRPRSVFLLGHIPVVRSGFTAPDAHDERALPADGFYADLDGNWTSSGDDSNYDNDTIPSNVELEIGRVDFADLGGIGTGMDDIGLTARYLDKDHAYRSAQMRFAPRGLVADRIGIDRGRAPAAQAYRDITAFFGPDAVIQANTEDNATDDERWISRVHSESYTWTFGSGAGDPDSIASLGTRDDTKIATSADIASGQLPAFVLLFGSHFLDWALPDNLLRSVLAAPTGGLGSGWSGRPNLLMHPMGLGETAGYGVRLTMNNDTLYFSQANAFCRGVHLAWMGDPTLRLAYTAPVGGLAGSRDGNTVRLSWQRSGDADGNAVTYVVYRAANTDGPYTRLTAAALGDQSYVDSSAPGGATYMVRAVKIEQTASGTYQNASEGVFWGGDSPSQSPIVGPAPTPAPPSNPTPPKSSGLVQFTVPLLFSPRPASQEPGPHPN
jgi:hypothetical protein